MSVYVQAECRTKSDSMNENGYWNSMYLSMWNKDENQLNELEWLFKSYYNLVYPYLYYCACVWGLTYHSKKN